MGKVLWVFFSFVLFAGAFKSFGATPFPPAVEERFQDVEHGSLRLKKFRYSFDDNTQASGASITLAGQFDPESILIRSYVYTNDGLESTSANTIRISCETAGDVLAATNPASFTEFGIINGAITSITSPVRSSDGCQLTMLIGSGTTGVTEGIITLIVEYFLPDKVR